LSIWFKVAFSRDTFCSLAIRWSAGHRKRGKLSRETFRKARRKIDPAGLNGRSRRASQVIVSPCRAWRPGVDSPNQFGKDHSIGSVGQQLLQYAAAGNYAFFA
jgi:hypothetical protein